MGQYMSIPMKSEFIETMITNPVKMEVKEVPNKEETQEPVAENTKDNNNLKNNVIE